LTNYLKEQMLPPVSVGQIPQFRRIGVRLHVKTSGGEAEIQLGAKAQLYPSDELLYDLRLKTSAVKSMIVYD
jgi:hypothetical protein